MEPQRSKWSKEHVRNLGDGWLASLLEEFVKLCESKLRRIIKVFTVNDNVVRSPKVKMAPTELNQPVVKLAPVFYDGVSEIKNRGVDVGASSNQQQEPSESII